VEFVNDAGAWQARRQWLYRIEPTGSIPGFETICSDGENGLTELLALDNTRSLSLERACLQNSVSRAARNTARIFMVDVADAEDVSGVSSLAGMSVQEAKKTAVLDLDTLIPSLPASLAQLDNFEGLAFGPTLPDGSRTLLVLSDDNFRETQQTAVILLRIVP
jgi:hypothetical protein